MHVLKEVQCCAQDDPLYTVLVTFAERLPNCLLLCGLASDADAGATTVRAWRVLLDFAELNALGRDVMAGVGKVEHAPERRVRVWFRDLEEREIRSVWRGQRQLVDGRYNAGVLNRPLEVPRGFTTNNPRGGRAMTRI